MGILFFSSSLMDRHYRAGLQHTIFMHMKLPIRYTFLFIFFYFFFYSGSVVFSQSNAIGIVRINNLNLRPEPNKNNSPLCRLQKGTPVNIIGYEKDWLKVLYNGQTGYISNHIEYVHIISLKDKKKGEKGITDGQDVNISFNAVQNEAKDIFRKIENTNREAEAYFRKEVDIIGELNKTDIKLDHAGKRIASLKSKIKEIEKKIEQNTKAYKDLQKDISINEKYTAKRLVAFYKLSLLGSMNIIASSGSLTELMQRKNTIKRIFDYDMSIRTRLIEKKSKFENISDMLFGQKSEILSMKDNLDNQVLIISRERCRRLKILEDIRNKRSLKIAALKSLKEAAGILDKTVESFGLKYGKEQSWTKSKIKKFCLLKGSLKMPVAGKIINFYGPYKNTGFNIVNFRNGIDIKAERGEPVRAVCGGKILYAKWFKGYGNLIIMDHGDNYYTLYAHADELFAVKGDIVEAGDVVATVGDTGSMIGANLYFEVRHHGKPMDPLEWILKDRKG